MKRSKNIICLVFIMMLLLAVLNTSNVYAEDDDDLKGDFTDLLDEDAPIGEYILSKFKDVFTEDYEPYKYMDEPTDDKDIIVGGIPLEIERYPIERYMANNEDTSGIFGINLYSINNMLMGINHNIVQVTDSSLQMFSEDRLDKFADDIATVSRSVYMTLRVHFAEMFFVILISYLIFVYVSKASFKETFRRFGMFIIILLVAGYWISNAGFLLKSMNNLSNELQASLVSAGSGLVNIMDSEREGVYDDVSRMDTEDRVEGTTAVLRNIYFDIVMKKPYLLINYGTTDEDKINDNDKVKDLGFGFDKYDRIDRMLAFNLSSRGTGYRMAHANLEVEKNNNSNVASGSSFKQSGLVFMMLFIVIALSIPFILLGLLNFLLQLIAIILTLVLPFAFVISYLPFFQNSIWKAFGNVITVFLAKGVLGVLMFLMYLLTYLMYLLIKPTSTGMYLLHVVCLIIILYLAIFKRNKIISFVTAGKVRSISSAVPALNTLYGTQYKNAKNRVENSRSKNDVKSPIKSKKRSSNNMNRTAMTSPEGNEVNKNKNSNNKKRLFPKRTPQNKRKNQDIDNRENENKVTKDDEQRSLNVVQMNTNKDKDKNELKGIDNDNKSFNNNGTLNHETDHERTIQTNLDKVNKTDRKIGSVDRSPNGVRTQRETDEASNGMIKSITGIDGAKFKDFEANFENKFRNDPVHRNLRKFAGTDWENQGYGKQSKEDIDSVQDRKKERDT